MQLHVIRKVQVLVTRDGRADEDNVLALEPIKAVRQQPTADT